MNSLQHTTKAIKFQEKSYLLEQQQKDVISSIQYAQRIQESILPDVTKLKKYFTPSNVLEIGAGIGRVTENLLVDYFKEITLVEQNEKFLKKAEEKLSFYTKKTDDNAVKIRYIPGEMQSIRKMNLRRGLCRHAGSDGANA